MATPYKPTSRQLTVLALAATQPVTRKGVNANGADCAEALDTLKENGFVEFSWNRGDWDIVVTLEGQQVAERQRERTQHVANISRVPACPSCVVINCVCRIKLACIGDGPHSLGCHGSHD
jgi:hypothetical protein